MTGRLRVFAAVASFVALELAALPADRSIAQYVRRAWTVESGLPHGTVRGITQTADGYLWVASYEGLVRFNGESFRIFDRSSAAGLVNGSIDTLCRTKDDAIWLGTSDGVIRYQRGTFEHFPLPADAGTAGAIVAANDAGVWIGTARGRVFRIRGDAPAVPVAIKLPNGPIAALAVSGDALWIGTSHGLFRYQQGKVEAWQREQGLSDSTIRSLLVDGDALLVGTEAGLDRIAGGRVESVAGLPADQFTALLRDRDGNLWAGTYRNGVYRLSAGAPSNYSVAEGLLQSTVRALFEDDEGSIWVGTQSGLEQLRQGTFVTWSSRDGFTDDLVRTIFEDRAGVMWAGTATSLHRFVDGRWLEVKHPAMSRILAMEEGKDGTRWLGTATGLVRVRGDETVVLTTANGLSNNSVRDVHEDRQGIVWVATDYGLNRILPDGTIENLAGRSGLTADYVLGLTETPDGRIWAATGAGLGEYDGTRFVLHSSPQFPTDRLFGIASDADGTVWVATEVNGVVRFRNGKASAITTRHGLPTDKIISLVDDGRGRIWFGSVRGVFVVEKSSLDAVADGKASRVSHTFFDESDGLGSRQCNGAANPSALLTRDGRVWMATAHGISATVAAGVKPLPLRRPMVERIRINGREVAPETLRRVAPGADRIEFEFAGLSLAAPERLRYRYRLAGYDDAWIEAGGTRVASYTKVPAGDHEFIVSSSRDGRRWSETSVPLSLSPRFYETRWFIALCLTLALALLYAAHTLRLRITKERSRRLEKLVEERTRQISEEKERTEAALRDAERQEQLAEQALAEAEDANRAKSVFLATTSHELRTPLNAIIGFSDILISNLSNQVDSRQVAFLHNIHSSGEYLLGIINNILDLSKIEAGRMELNPETILLRETVLGICAVMKGVTTLHSITIEVEIPEDLPMFEADAAMVKQILYNLMSNAVKFSPEHSTVTVSARSLAAEESPLGEASIEVSIADRGVGIEPRDLAIIFEEFRQAGKGRRQGTGLGLALVKRFVELHSGTISVVSVPDAGSTFTVVLPRLRPARPASEARQRGSVAL